MIGKNILAQQFMNAIKDLINHVKKLEERIEKLEKRAKEEDDLYNTMI